MRLVPGRLRPIMAIFCACLLTGPMLASAQEEPSTPVASPEAFIAPEFAIIPIGDYDNGWFVLELQQGETVNLTAGITNVGEVAVNLRSYAANTYNPPNGGFAAGSDDEELFGAATWVTYPNETFEMAPGDQRLVDFQVTVPEDAAPGEYVTALVVQTNETLDVPDSETLRQFIRSAVSIEITIPGDATTGFELGEPVVTQLGMDWMIDVPITNTGTARIRPRGELTVSRTDGEQVSKTAVEMGSVYGGNSSSVRVTLPGQLEIGDYVISLDLTDDASGATASISDVPLRLAEPEVVDVETFIVEAATVKPNGDPIQYADVAATIVNNGQTIPTANVTLNALRDGEPVESYPLAEDQALIQGTTNFSQRYIPVSGWESGIWTFELVISAVNGDTETVLATVAIVDQITVP